MYNPCMRIIQLCVIILWVNRKCSIFGLDKPQTYIRRSKRLTCKLTSVFLCVIRFLSNRRICPRNCRYFSSLFRNPAEMSHTCRGTISLHGALIHTVDACTFVVSNGGTQTFHIKAATEVERQQWVTALELAKAKAIQAMESGLYPEMIIRFLFHICEREKESFVKIIM